MNKGIFTQLDIDKAITILESSGKLILDSPNDIINNYISHEYLKTDLIEKRLKEVKKVTKDMIINFSKKIHMDTIYLLEGGNIIEENTSN